MLGRCGGDPSGYAAQAFLDQLFEAPARAVAGQHGQIMQMDKAFAVRLRDLIIIDLGQPVVGSDRTGVGQDQTADTQGNGGVFLDTPVFLRADIAVHQLLVVQKGLLCVAHLLVLAAVKDIALGCFGIACLHQRTLDAVLDFFHLGHFIRFLTSAHQQKSNRS